MAVHLADRPAHPRPLDLPARRLGRAVALASSRSDQGGVDLNFIGFSNYQQLLFGLERSHFLGVLKSPSPLGWAIVVATVALAGLGLDRAPSAAAGSGRSGWSLRLFAGVLLVGFVWLLVQALRQRRRPARAR